MSKNPNVSDLSARIGAELRAYHGRLKFSWTGIAKATGIPRANLYRMLNGETDIPVANLMLICAAAGIDAADLIEEATRHMPDNYLQSLLVTEGLSASSDNVTELVNWDEYRGRKAADNDAEAGTDEPDPA